MSVMRVNRGVEGRQLAEFTLLLQDFEIYITGAAIVQPSLYDENLGPGFSNLLIMQLEFTFVATPCERAW